MYLKIAFATSGDTKHAFPMDAIFLYVKVDKNCL